MKAPEDFFQFLEESLRAITRDSYTDDARVGQVYALVSKFFVAIGEDEPLHFTTLFARITHAGTRMQVPSALLRRMQRFRIDAESFIRKGRIEGNMQTRDIWVSGAYALHDFASLCIAIPKSTSTFQLIGIPAPEIPAPRSRTGAFKRQAHLVAYDILRAQDILLVYDEDAPEHELRLKFGEVGRSELFRENILQAVSLIGFPLTLSVLDIDIDADGSYSPRVVVIEPDYLIDISMIAECYAEAGADVRLYLPKKYQDNPATPALLIGKIANFFLDALIHDPEQTFQDLFPKSFFLNPLEFATLGDDEVWQMTKDCESHFAHLKQVILEEFETLGMDRRKMYIEPAFFCPAYGIQGRLDLFQSGDNGRHIIELKSGQPFQANAYGLSSAHYAQTLLYDLMIRAVYEFKTKQTCYILYSRAPVNTLRFAPPVEAIQREVIGLRNEILLTEKALCLQNVTDDGMLERIKPEFFPDVKGFMQRDIAQFNEVWESLDALEKQYIRIFSRFIAREQYLAKVGMHGSDQVNGLAGLWLDSPQEKEDQFAIYRDLTVTAVRTLDSHDAYIDFSKETLSSGLANFRIGDIAVLYPSLEKEPSILRTQIHKCTVTALSEGQITVRLRSKQVNYEDIYAHPRWVLEHDLYDKTFNTMHRALYMLAKASPEKRALFLGRKAPARAHKEVTRMHDGVGAHQNAVINRILSAPEYFLLWGPPGTGKTSIVLHHLVRYYLENTKERIVLLAYTNRAVDEICEALDMIGGDIRSRYTRIGSHVGTGGPYQEQLLGNKIQGMTKRREVVNFLISQRIIVGTISSISGRMELFRIVRADITIVDEASQILEPMLAGLLPLFRKWVLIGDHKQLPAVVAQPQSKTRLGVDAISEIGLTDTRDSYFERLFEECTKHRWTWACGSLHEQGRMHEQIMDFPGRTFYDGQLHMLPVAQHNGRDYTGALKTMHPPGRDSISEAIASKRMLWLPSTPVPLQQFSKTHDDEARIVVRIIQELVALYGKLPDLGVITPFRAQIANIRAYLQENDLDPNAFTIDTVERYQGSARDIIILSLCLHHPSQLSRVVSSSRDGTDRKLNVALTRAREQFILVASESVLRTNKTYSALADACFRVERKITKAPSKAQ